MMKFTKKEEDFLRKQSVARVATVSEKGWPQVTPVIHIYYDGKLYFITDYGTRKLKNLQRDSKAGVVVDVFARQPQSVVVQGRARIIEKGREYVEIEKRFEERHSYYRSNPVKEGEAPIIEILPLRKYSSL